MTGFRTMTEESFRSRLKNTLTILHSNIVTDSDIFGQNEKVLRNGDSSQTHQY